ncbi:MAG: glutathione S-transferase family protein [Alphaproteobacteria bacterium]|nr:glutathione S-transferase family protein [Alphaproteobacteria bacterium]
MTYQLYFAPGTCSLAVHVLLREVGASFELIKEDIKANPRNAEYMKLNPRGSVPILVVDGKVLREGAAILTYIAETHESSLLPSSGWERAKAMEWLAFGNSTLHPVYGRLFGMKGKLGDKAPENEFYQMGVAAIKKYWAEVESVLATQEYIAGNTITVGDILLSVIASWSPLISPEITFGAKTTAYLEKIRSRESYVSSVDAEKSAKKAA